MFLLYQISRKFKEIAIKVCDNDGEFLLIEAAEQLPKWAKPEVCTNRVFVINGAIKLIPPNVLTDNSSKHYVIITDNIAIFSLTTLCYDLFNF